MDDEVRITRKSRITGEETEQEQEPDKRREEIATIIIIIIITSQSVKVKKILPSQGETFWRYIIFFFSFLLLVQVKA